MRSYKTLDSLDPLTGALRAFDLLGQLPLREPRLLPTDPLHDALAIADDWNAVAEDLLAAYQAVLDDQAIRETLEEIRDHEANAVREALRSIQLQIDQALETFESSSNLAGASSHEANEDPEGQMTLFQVDREKKAG